MVRPKRWRHVYNKVEFNYFKPQGVPMSELEEINLTVEETEALRHTEVEEMEQTKAAEKMNVSQPTYHRILKSARKKIADALISGKAIKIQGGTFKMIDPDNSFRPGKRFKQRGRGYGRGRRFQN
jgi:predicted DNA-binding protein (UPF0251 family)